MKFCPYCKAKLETIDSYYVCNNCDYAYPARDWVGTNNKYYKRWQNKRPFHFKNRMSHILTTIMKEVVDNNKRYGEFLGLRIDYDACKNSIEEVNKIEEKYYNDNEPLEFNLPFPTGIFI